MGPEQSLFKERYRMIFENYEPLLERLAARKLPPSKGELFYALELELHALAPQERVDLITCFPRLVAGPVKDLSHEEHEAAGLNNVNSDEEKEFQSLNQQYLDKFLFPFVICSRDHKKEEIIKIFKERLANSVPIEIANALSEIKRIFWHRLNTMHFA